MRARRSRSQHARRWERGRPARHANRARKSLPLCCPLSREAGEGGLWSAEAELPPTLKLTLQHSKQVSARLPSPTAGERGGGEGSKNAHTPARSELKRCTLIRGDTGGLKG